MIIRYLMLSALALAGIPAAAQTVAVEVNGLVCAFCAQGIEKTLRKFDAVEDVFVSLEHRTVAFALKDGAELSDVTVSDAIRNAGYSVVAVERSDETLEALERRVRATHTP
ncbi:MAG TPA: heavy-metal-associated domain-containing protein [Candidatus Saccharimonadia bacterium]|nr:heavy-metal-associated domain-containing protein [Candidatus Saccharimonadia bacterium]